MCRHKSFRLIKVNRLIERPSIVNMLNIFHDPKFTWKKSQSYQIASTSIDRYETKDVPKESNDLNEIESVNKVWFFSFFNKMNFHHAFEMKRQEKWSAMRRQCKGQRVRSKDVELKTAWLHPLETSVAIARRVELASALIYCTARWSRASLKDGKLWCGKGNSWKVLWAVDTCFEKGRKASIVEMRNQIKRVFCCHEDEKEKEKEENGNSQKKKKKSTFEIKCGNEKCSERPISMIWFGKTMD